VAAYNPLKDPDGKGAALIIDLLAEVLGKRLEALQGDRPIPEKPASADLPAVTQPAAEEKSEPPPVGSGEAWSSDDSASSLSDTADDPQSERQPEDLGDAGDPPA